MNDFLIFFITFMLLAAAVAFLAALLILLANNREEPGKRKDLRSALKNSFSLHLDAQKPLYRHLWFWVAALTPILVGISLGLPIWLEYSFSLSQAGYETFLEISKLPLYVMAPAVPLGMVVAAFHKTKQTAEQIRQAESSNNFKNYFEHKKIFKEQLETVKGKEISPGSESAWHQFIFPDAERGLFSISEDLAYEIKLINEILQDFELLSKSLEYISKHGNPFFWQAKAINKEILQTRIVSDNKLYKNFVDVSENSLIGPIHINRFNLFSDALDATRGTQLSAGSSNKEVAIRFRLVNRDAILSLVSYDNLDFYDFLSCEITSRMKVDQGKASEVINKLHFWKEHSEDLPPVIVVEKYIYEYLLAVIDSEDRRALHLAEQYKAKKEQVSCS